MDKVYAINGIKMTMLQAEREYAHRQVVSSIKTIRDILDRVEGNMESGRIVADDGLQGNEWRLYKYLSELEMYDMMVAQLKRGEIDGEEL